MRVQPISVYNVRKNVVTKPKIKETPDGVSPQQAQVSFKGDKGAALGIVGGAALGALGAAAIIATGGLAGVVAAIGYGQTLVTGAAACTHIGGIAGGLIEDSLDKK